MSIIAPPVPKNRESKNVNGKSVLGNALSSKMNQLVTTDDGKTLTVAQVMAERLANIAMFAENNTDAIAAQKLIYERVIGKAAVVKDDEAKPMPKVIFALSEDGLDKVNDSINKEIEKDLEDDGSGLIVAEMDGKEWIG